MTPSRQPVTFVNRRGERLVGIVHPPAGGASDRAVLLLSPGVKTRVAPHRLYNRLSEVLVRQGYWVFRFDFYGLGDSEGEINEPYLADLYGSVALGRYVDDTRDALAWMTAHYPVTQFVVGGLCGGAITGLLAAVGEPRIVGLLGLGLPITVDGSSVDKVAQMTSGQLAGIRKGYLRKLVDPKSWKRLLTFQTDLRLLKRAFARPAAPVPAAPAGGQSAAGNLNPHFAPAFFAALEQGVQMLLLFSEMDRLWWEFDEKHLRAHPGVLERYADRLHVDVVKEANHIFTLDAWQAEVDARVAAWLQTAFGSAADALAGAAAGADRQAS